MSVFEQRNQAIMNRDSSRLINTLHDNFKFIRHQSGTSMNKTEMSEMFDQWMSAGKLVSHSHRCIYENDEILVEHSIVDFPDGSTEAIIGVHILEDGKIIRTETGATPISA